MYGCLTRARRYEGGVGGVRNPDLTYRALSAAFWLGVAFALVGIGYAIGTSLESALLGFLGADFIFLIVMSLFTSRQGGTARDRH